MVAFLPPVWTKIPAADRVGVAAVALAAAFVALVVGTRVRQVHFRPRLFKRPQVPTAESVDTSWFAPHSLDGFPEEVVHLNPRAPDAPSLDRLYAAWVLATHTPGLDARWLERNLALPADAAHLIVEAAESRHREPATRENLDEQAGTPLDKREIRANTEEDASVPGRGRAGRPWATGPPSSGPGHGR
ncbi:hypothetical protein [Streptomyces brasiliensis]|uniref:hypothetical protein n=1 Tax=Streptomyces brasiliensis TaxID=1954 RepID=UPI001670CBE1|nr:hypothetical protein [Streptomyces brasiliensis]